MKPERWDEAQAIFLRALEVPSHEREELVRARCISDDELRDEVLRMIRANRPNTSFLVAPTPGPNGAPEDDGPHHSMGDFELLEEIGRGGMGVVYKAWQRSLRRHVAVKVLPRNLLLPPRQVERFQRESRAVGRLRHPGIVRVLTVGELEGTHYFAMELIDGHDLSTEIIALRDHIKPPDGDSVQLPHSRANDYFRTVARIVRDAADALSYAHENGVVHRDVKPSNLLLDSEGAVKLVDFGLARDEQQGTITRTGELAGTPHYMSPEQVRARRLQVDNRTDVYSLGVVMFELLTLKLPFNGRTSQEVMSKIVQLDAPRIRRLNPRVPRDLEVVCGTAMAKRLEDRYVDAAAFRDDLDRFLSHRAIQARPPSPLQLARRFAERNRTGLVIALVLLIAVWAGFAIQKERQSRARIGESLVTIASTLATGPLRLQPPTSVTRLRSAVRTLRSEGGVLAGERADELRQAEAALEDYRRALYEEAETDLAFAREPDQPAGAREMRRLHALRTLVQLAGLFPEDEELQQAANAESVYPTLGVRALDSAGRELGAQVSLREVDLGTGEPADRVLLGRTPLADEPVAPGYYRVVVTFDDGGFREIPCLMNAAFMEVELEAVRRNDESAITAGMVRFEATPYTFGAFPGGDVYANKTVPLGAFFVDPTEVSNAEYHDFVVASHGEHMPKYWNEVDDMLAFLAEYGDLPVVGIDWNDAVAYAQWAGKRLPTAAEWHYFAGGIDHRALPYLAAEGEPIRGNVHQESLRGATPWERYLVGARPVRSHPEARTPEGLYHVYGNVFEFTESIPVTFLSETTSIPRHWDRWRFGQTWNAATNGRGMHDFAYAGIGPRYRVNHIGFRCVKSAAP